MGAAAPPLSTDDLKAVILAALRPDISFILKSELKEALSEESQAVKNELAVFYTELDTVKITVSDMEQGLSACSDDMTTLQAMVKKLETDVASLKEQCIHFFMQRSNIRIMGVAEDPGSSSASLVLKFLKEALKMAKDVLVDHSHWGSQARKPGRKPCIIVAKLHSYQDCIDVLRHVREFGPL